VMVSGCTSELSSLADVLVADEPLVDEVLARLPRLELEIADVLIAVHLIGRSGGFSISPREMRG